MIERRHAEPARAEPDVRGREEVEVLTRLGVMDWAAPRKRIVADQVVDISILKEVAEGDF